MKHVYLCVHCGFPNKELYKKFSPSALTLQKCVNCQQVIDKYIEYDLTVVFIDVLLLKLSAYRHILYNTENKVFLRRLLPLTLLSSAYVDYVYQKQNTDNPSQEPVFYELEWNYYFICFHHVTKLIVFSLTFLLFSFLTCKSFKSPEHLSYLCILEGLALSSCWNLVTIPSLVWNHYSSYSILSQAALFVSCIHTFRVCVQPNYWASTLTVTCAFVMQWSVSKWMISMNPAM